MSAAGGTISPLPDPRSLLTGPVVFDTMGLTFMARTMRTQLLRDAFGGRIMVPPFVMNEARNWAKREEPLRALFNPEPCMQVVPLTRDQVKRVFARQRAWHGAAAIEADYTLNRGEAECLELCKTNGWPVVSHDHKARLYGPPQGTPVLCLVDVLLVCVKRGLLKPERGWTSYEKMCNQPVGMYECRDWPLAAASRAQFMSVATQLLSEA